MRILVYQNIQNICVHKYTGYVYSVLVMYIGYVHTGYVHCIYKYAYMFSVPDMSLRKVSNLLNHITAYISMLICSAYHVQAPAAYMYVCTYPFYV
jgi:hypothetical protein